MLTDDRSTNATNAAVAPPANVYHSVGNANPQYADAPAYQQNAFDNQPPANNAKNAGPVKTGLRQVLMGMLGGFSYGASQAMTKAAGLPTDEERAINMAQMAHLNAQTQLTQQQAAQMVNTVPVQMPNGTLVHLPASMAKDLLKQQLANQGKTDTQGLKNEGGLDVQGLKNEGALDTQGAKDATNLKIAEQRTQSLRELTKMRMQMSQQIAANHDATALNAAQIRARTPMMKEGMKSYDVALDADNRLQQMQQQAAAPNPAGDKALLFNHIAMTLGAVKGGRVTNAEIEAHLKARSLPDDVMQAWDRASTGKSLTSDQRTNFLKLANEVRDAAWDRAYRRADFYGVIDSPEDNPALKPANTSVPKPGVPGAVRQKMGAATDPLGIRK